MGRLATGLWAGLGASGVALALWATGALDGLERATWTGRVRAHAKPSPATPRIRVILLDQASLDWGSRENQWPWPWPREVAGAVASFCARGGARAVAFDVLYTEPSVHGVGDDAAFASALKAGAPFVAAVQTGAGQGARQWPQDAPARPALSGLGASPFAASDPAFGATFPIPEARDGAALLGTVQASPDPDGVNRRTYALRLLDGQALPSLGLAAYLAGEGRSTSLAWKPGWLQVGARTVPVDGEGRALLRFRGPSGTHPTFSAASIIQSELRLREGQPATVDPALFKDAYVFFGYSAPGLMDLRPTPAGAATPGVEIHATFLDNLLAGDFLRTLPKGAAAALIALFGALGALAGALSQRTWHHVAGLGFFAALPFAVGHGAYVKGFEVPVMASLASGVLAQLGVMAVAYATVGRQKRFLKGAFRHYLGEEVIDQLLADPSRLQLGGERRELTLFFSDIEKFSTFSERLDPATLTTLLNTYLTEMGRVLTREGAYLDKYIGDAIVAFWNAPMDQADHARRACRAALLCQRRLAELRPDFEARLGVTVKARIGLNTGVVAVGNMGSQDRFNYTVLGDAANLASRLEGANKAFGSYLMVSEATWMAAGGDFVGRELGRLRVMGRSGAVRVFELAGLPGEPRPAHFEAFEAALALFYAGDFTQAEAVFQAIPGDAASLFYVEQCRQMQAHPPKDWEGVLALTEK